MPKQQNSESEIDTEWMKFMSRITRQQNCDAKDAGDDDDDSDDTDNATTTGNAPAPAPALANYAMVGGDIRKANDGALIGVPIKPRKSCISKKSQRRTYSFIDNDPSLNVNDTVTAAAAVAVTAATTSSGAVDIAAGIRSRFTPIYISTKTKIAYLSRPVDIYDIFWKIPVQHYYKRAEGVIKKQIKFQTTDPAVVASIKEKLQAQPRCYDEYVIEHIDNPNGRIPYKDQRKVSIGLCKKDLAGGNHKQKRAFFNCFVVILRINGGIAPPEERAPEDDILYKEMHVKVFNTGKLEIPGIQEDRTLVQVLQLLVTVLRPFLGEELDYIRNRCETALINSNFNCGYYIDRDKLFDLLKYKYRLNCNYDSCSYPGIQSKFYYIPGKSHDEQNGQQPVSMEMPYYEVSFMIFRTGSILIVGKCNEDILTVIYRYICLILEKEYSLIQMGFIPSPQEEESKTGGGSGGGGGGGTRNTRKKKLNITNVQFYVESE
jgi:hypothetical protein